MSEYGEALGPGVRIEEFEIVRELGAGGFGITYLARDLQLDRAVAVKEYLPQDWGTRRFDGTIGPRSSSVEADYQWGLERFLEEARVLARLNHANIVRVYRVIEASGTAYLVMEYIEGRSLADELRVAGRLGEARGAWDASGSGGGTCRGARSGPASPGHKAGKCDVAGERRLAGADRLRVGEAADRAAVAVDDGGADAGVRADRAVQFEGQPGAVDGHLRAGGGGVCGACRAVAG